jgi:hypothetical protein
MIRYWTWGGCYIGVRQKDYLVACNGTVLGKFHGKEIYDQNGKYIGELGRSDRLIKNRTKDTYRRPGFSLGVKGTISEPYKDCAPYPMIPGFEDFTHK